MDDTPPDADRQPMRVTVVDHPLAAQLLTRLRDEVTDRAGFRRAMDDLSGILVYEATRGIEVESVAIRTPIGPTAGTRITNPPLVVPVLRAGLGMLGGVLRYLPESYMSSVPDELAGRPVIVLDPMLATGGSLQHACRTLVERGAGPVTAVCVLAAPEGVARIEESGLVAHVVTASIDERLNDDAYIVPGLGDAGDRLFGTA